MEYCNRFYLKDVHKRKHEASDNFKPFRVCVDVQHGVCWSLHHPADGDFFHLHRHHLQ